MFLLMHFVEERASFDIRPLVGFNPVKIQDEQIKNQIDQIEIRENQT